MIRIVLASLALVLGTGCTGVPTTLVGPPAGPDDPLAGERGDPALDGVARITRGPYLQAPTSSSIVISWETDVAAASRVEYGATAALGLVADGRTFKGEEPLGGTSPSHFQHEVRIEGLPSSMQHHYRVVSAALPSADAVFRTAPLAGETIRLGIYGDTRRSSEDSGPRAGHLGVVALLRAAAPDLLVHTGDYVNFGSNEAEWDELFAVEADLLREAPLVPVFGNHEALFGGSFFDAAFRAASDGAPDAGRRFLSTDYGDLHLAVLDQWSGTLEEQAAWLDEDLAVAAARGPGLRVVALHAPLYTAASGHEADEASRALLEPILRRRGVQLLLAGHNHVYERWEVDGLVELVVGGGGAPLHELEADPTGLRRAAAAEHSAVIAELAGGVGTFRALAVDGQELDCVVVHVDGAPPAPCP